MPTPLIDYGHPDSWSTRLWRRRPQLFGCAVILFIAIAYWLLVPTLNWSGGVTAEVRLQVTDATTGRPLSNVTLLSLNNNGEPIGLPGTTDASGVGTVTAAVSAGGARGLLHSRTGFGSSEPQILLQAPGYIDEHVAPGHGSTVQILGFGRKPKLRVTVALTSATQPSQ